jgi:RHS repeat-associated protein
MLVVFFFTVNFMLTSVVNAAPSENQRATVVQKKNLTADIGDMPNKLPSTKLEIQDKRTEFSTCFLNPDGSFTEEVYAQPKFYQDPTDKKWKDIDNNLKVNAAGKLENGAGSFKADFAPQADSSNLVSVTKEGKSISLAPVQGNSITGTVNNNEITYSNLFSNTDAHYYVNGDSVKEDLVLNSYNNQNTFSYEVKLNGAIATTDSTGTIMFKDNSGKKLWYFPKAFMTDANGKYSDKVTLTLRQANGKTFVYVTADPTFLQDSNTLYPVTIDPTIDSWNVMTDSYISATNPNTSYSTATSMYTGLTPSYGATRALGQFYLPALPSSSKITSANFNAYQWKVDSTNVTIDLFRNTSSWTGSTTWNTQPTTASTRESTVTSNVSGAYWQWDITQLTKDWYNGVQVNNGFTLKQQNETTSPYRAFNAVDSGSNTPRLTINYTVDPVGTESYWGFSKDNVNTANGNLVLQQGDLSIPGRGIPVSISRTYNSRASSTAGMFGYGWRSNVEAQLVDSGSGPITLIDADGTRHIFGQSVGGGYYAVDGIYLTLIKNGDGTYTITQTDGTIVNFNTSGQISSMMDTNNNTTSYTYTSGKLTTITDASGRTTTIAYGTNGYVSIITYNPTSQAVTYNYDANGNLTKVTDAAGKYETYGNYDSDHNLGTITDERSITTTITYDVANDRVSSISRPITIDGVQQTSTTNYNYYTAYSVTSVIDGEGKRIDYSYSANGNILQTTVNPLDAANKAVTVYAYDGYNNLTLTKDANTNKGDSYHNAFIYSYDGSGNITGVTQQQPGVISSTDGYISTFDINGNVTGTQISGGQNETATYDSKNNQTSSTDPMNNTSSSDYDTKNNNLDSVDPFIQTNANRYFSNGNMQYSTAQMSAADNLVANSSFEIDANSDNLPDNWTQLLQSGTTATYAWTSTSKFGNKAVSISNPTGWAVESADSTSCTTTDKFVVSAYVKTANTTGTAYVKADFYDNNNNWLGQSASNCIKGTNDWTRLQAVVNTIPANTTKIRATVGMNAGTGTAYFDGVQLEKGTVLSAYNLVDNSSFERNAGLNTLPTNWTSSGNLSAASDGTDNSDPYVGSYDLKLTGESGKNKYITQHINLLGTTDTRFTLSGWSKQIGATTSGGNYLMMVRLNDSNGNPLEWHGNDFDKSTSGWQHVAAEIIPGTAFSSIDVYYYYYNQTGTAWFDAMRLEVGDNITKNTYDTNENYITGVTDGLGNTVNSTYDGAGNTLTVKDAKNQTTSFQYDPSNLLTQVTDAKNGVTSYGYDNAGNMTTVTDARNKVTTYAYNEFNQESSITNALNQVTQFGYNKDGASNKVVLPKGDSITSTYDALNQLGSLSYNGVQKWSYGYDANGNVTTINNIAAGTTTTNTFDKNNRVKNVSEGANNSFGYSYDNNGNLTSLSATAVSTTNTTTNTFNSLNQLIALSHNSSNVAKFVYDERGNIVSISHANGTYTAYEYDSDNRLTSLKNYNTSGTILDSYSYTYDANGNRTSVTSTAGTINYQYDELNRLTQETLLDGTTITYAYDAAGNRTSKTVTNGGSTTTNYTYDDGNQLTAVNGQAYTYDANGNLTSNGTKTFVYNEINQLVQVKTSGGTVIASYTYDDQGRRISVTASGSTVYYHYSGDKVIYVTDGNNIITADYTYDAAGNPATLTYGGVTYYYHLDGHGSVTTLTDGSGNIAAQYTYDAWGNILSQSGAMASINPFRYSGYYYDEATGLYYLMARYYDASVGRFITRDSIDDVNLYSYCDGNPVNGIDPSGKMGEPVSMAQLRNLSDLELIARTLYGECASNTNFALQGVAWCIINRQIVKVADNGYYGWSYKNIVLKASQFTGLTGTDIANGEGQGRTMKDINTPAGKDKWNKALSIAGWMVKYKGQRSKLQSRITNKIGFRRYFTDKSVILSCIKKGKLPSMITMMTPLNEDGDNVFWNWRGEQYAP